MRVFFILLICVYHREIILRYGMIRRQWRFEEIRSEGRSFGSLTSSLRYALLTTYICVNIYVCRYVLYI